MQLDNTSSYLGNPLLKRANVSVEWTEETISEYQKCMEDPLYFVQNYIKIVSLDEGLISFEMFPFQKEILGTIHNNRFTIAKLPRQSGKTTTMVSYILHYILFNDNINVAILANKAATARDILGRLQLAYENLPKWLQQGVMVWNKGSLELENGSRVIASATSSSAVRGGSYNCISSDSLITIKNVNTGKVENISIANFSRRFEEDRWEVYTPNGFRKFYGLSKSISTNNVKLLFSNGSELKCTLDHRIATTIGFIEAKQLTESHSILSKDGIVHLINSIPSNDKLEVYDLLNVEKDNCFYANNILVHNCIVLDEFAFVPQNIAEDFFSSVYPTISSGKSTKVVIISTPNGMNLFYKLWSDAENQINSYVPIEVHWSEVPGRDEKWKAETIANTSAEQFSREFDCQFLGSTNTLIHPTKIRTMAYRNPIKSNAGLDVYENPIEGNTYFLVADVARGLSNDFSAFIVFDVTTVPYKIAAKYRNNEIKPMLFPNIISEVAKAYNLAHVLIEVNDIGEQVAHALQFDLEYGNLIMAAMRGRAGQILGGGFSGGKAQLGVRTSKAVKSTGCSNIKQIIETDKLIIQDYDLITEWSTFIQKGQSYEAEDGHSDDLAMCCVIFGWAAQQQYFKELTNDDIRARLFLEQQGQIEQDMAPFGFIDDGVSDYHNEESVVDEYGTKWSSVVRTYDTPW